MSEVVAESVRIEHPACGPDRAPRDVPRFLERALRLRALQHPALPRVHRIVADVDAPIVHVDAQRGVDLGTLLVGAARRNRAEPVPVAVVFTTIASVLDALVSLHGATGPDGVRAEIVHGRLGLGTITVDTHGDVRVCDVFAGAAVHGNSREACVEPERFAFQAPESFSSGTLDGRADLFAVGCVAFDLLAGIEIARRRWLRMASARGALPAAHFPSIERADVPDGFRAWIARAVSLRANERWYSAAQALGAWFQCGAVAGISIDQQATASFVRDVDRGRGASAAPKLRVPASIVRADPAAVTVAQRGWRAGGARSLGDALDATTPDAVALPGTRYVLRRLIVATTRTRVHEALDLELGRSVVIKRPSETADRSAHRRWAREARALAGIDHPNVVRLLDTGRDATGTPFLALAPAPGVTLSERIRAQGALPLLEIASCAIEVAKALDAVHSAGWIHADVTSRNIMWGDDGRVRLIDFGLACRPSSALDRADGADPAAARVDSFGTPGYAPPEQIAGGPIDVRADVYGLGAVLYEAWTGCRTVHATTLLGALDEQRVAGIEVPLRGADPFASQLHALVRDCLARDPQGRPPTAYAVLERAEALVARCAGQPTQTTQTTQSSSAPSAHVADTPSDARASHDTRRARRRATGPLAWGLLAIATALALVVVGFGLGRRRMVRTRDSVTHRDVSTATIPALSRPSELCETSRR